MASLTDYARNQHLDFYRGQTLTPPTNWYVGLFTTMATAAGGGSEPTDSAYSRQPIGANLLSWNATQGGTGSVSNGTSGLISNAGVIQFPTCLVEWGDLVGAGLYDAATGGNLWVFDAFRDAQGEPTTYFVTVGNRPSFAQQEFSFALVAHDPQ